MATTSLIEAAQIGDIGRMQVMLDAGLDINATGGPNHETALHYAARAGKLEACRLLCDRGVNIEAMGTADELNESGGNAFMEACRFGELDIAELLIERGCNVAARDTHGGSAFLWACQEGHQSTVDLFFRRNLLGEDVVGTLSCINDTDHEGITPLMSACSSPNHTDRKFVVCLLLISKGADIHAIDQKQYSVRGQRSRSLAPKKTKKKNIASHNLAALPQLTPQALIWAASNGHAEIVKLLVAHGADMYHESADYFLPMHYACMYGKKMLLTRPALCSLLPHHISILLLSILSNIIINCLFLPALPPLKATSQLCKTSCSSATTSTPHRPGQR